MGRYHIHVIKPGYTSWLDNKTLRADGTITLVTGRRNILVDTGGPWDTDALLEGLEMHALMPTEIDYVICTHGHSDHIGNLSLFTDAFMIVGYDINKLDTYRIHDFDSGVPYKIDDYVDVLPTPGHTGQDVSVIVRSGTDVVAIVGDLFESADDIENEQLWRSVSLNPELQKANRQKILEIATHIVPGHGDIFEIK